MNNEPNPAARRQSEASEIILSGHVWSAVWYLAWPTAINTLIQTAYTIVDRIFLGRLPNADQSLAAVGIGGTVLMIQFALVIGLSAGTSALTARFLGARQLDNAHEATGQSLTLSVIIGILSSIPFILIAGPLAALVGARPAVVPLAAGYTAITALSSVPLFIYMISSAALRSTGDVRSPLYAGTVVIALNIIFDWLLIFGIGPLPALGINGAAIATVISRIGGMLVILWYLRHSTLNRSFAHMRPHHAWFRRILNIGWPASAQNLLWTTAYAGFVRILALLPPDQVTPAQAALTVALTIESTAFMPGVAYSTAATPLVGQNLGAGNAERATSSAWVAVGQAVIIMSIVAVLFYVIPRQLALIFTNDQSVVPLIVSYLRINAVSEPFLAVAMVLRGALQGAGDTRVPAWITFITNWALRLPLAWALGIPIGLGAEGAWIAMSATTILSGLLLAAWFKIGRWKDIQV